MNKFLLLPVIASALLWAAPPAAAQGWDAGDEEIGTPAQRFLREHWETLAIAVPVTLFVLYSWIMGPSGAPRGYRWRGGFGNPGGFGGSTSLKNPWL